MKDVWHELLKFADYHRGLIAGVLVALLGGAYLVGCDVTTSSLTTPHRRVSAVELQAETRRIEAQLVERRNLLVAEVDTLNAEIDRFYESLQLAADDLERQMQFRGQMIHAIGGFALDAAAGQLNPVAAITALLSLISLGAASGLAVDNLRKNRVIQMLKEQQ